MLTCGPRTSRAVATAARNSASCGSGACAHRRAGFGAEVLNDDLLHVAVPAVQVADREEALARSRGVSPIPTRIPVVNGIASRPASSIVRRRTDRDLVGRSGVRPHPSRETVGRRLEHQAHRSAHVLEPRELLVGHHARVEVRQEPGLLEDANGRRADVLERRAVATVHQPARAPPDIAPPDGPEGEQSLLASAARGRASAIAITCSRLRYGCSSFAGGFAKVQ